MQFRSAATVVRRVRRSCAFRLVSTSAGRKLFLNRDHVVRTQFGNCRVAAVRCSLSVEEAKRRWDMDDKQALAWGHLAASTMLHASLLKGQERIIAKLAGERNVPHGYVEAFRLGELRGYMGEVDDDGADFGAAVDGRGVLSVQEVLFKQAKPVSSMVECDDGHTVRAWQR